MGNSIGAVVDTFVPTGSIDVYQLDRTQYLHRYIRRGTRRAVALHDCTAACLADGHMMQLHDEANSWVVYGRRQGLPPLSA